MSKVKGLFRYLPHFGYGKCGGRNRDCSTRKPRDWMDRAFETHDKELQESENLFDTKLADKKLGKTLRKGDSNQLGFYGKLYRLFAMIIFR